jgi:hypothetical protein
VKTSEDNKPDVWEGAEAAECPMPTVSNVTLTNLTEIVSQDPSATAVNLENCVYGLAPTAVMTNLANQQLRPIASLPSQFGANTTTLFAAGNYPHIITTPSQAGLQGFATAGVELNDFYMNYTQLLLNSHYPTKVQPPLTPPPPISYFDMW